MASTKKVKMEKKYTHVVFCFKDGSGFTSVRNKLCRIVVDFHSKVLSSQPIKIRSVPDFRCNFVWRIEDTLLASLSRERARISTRFMVEGDDKKEYMFGYAILTVDTAKLEVQPRPARYYPMVIAGVKLPTPATVRPVVNVLLTFHRNLHLTPNEPIYSAEVEDVKPVAIVKGTQRQVAPPRHPVAEDTKSKHTAGKQSKVRSSLSKIEEEVEEEEYAVEEEEYAVEEEEYAVEEEEYEVEEEEYEVEEEDRQSADYTGRSSQSSGGKSTGRSVDEKEQRKEMAAPGSGSKKKKPTLQLDYSLFRGLRPAVRDRDQPSESLSARTKTSDADEIASDNSQQDYGSTEVEEEAEEERTISESLKDTEREDVGEIEEEDVTLQQVDLPSAISLSSSSEKHTTISSQYPSTVELATSERLHKKSLLHSVSKEMIDSSFQGDKDNSTLSPKRVQTKPSLLTVPEDNESEYAESNVSQIPSLHVEDDECENEEFEEYEGSTPRKSRSSSAKSTSKRSSKSHKEDKKREPSEIFKELLSVVRIKPRDEDRLSESHKGDKKREASEIFEDLLSGTRIQASEPASDSPSDRNKTGSLKKLDSANLQQPSLALQLDEDQLSESHKEDKKREPSEIFKELLSIVRIKASDEDRLSESHKGDKKREASEIFEDLLSSARIQASEPASDSTSDRNKTGSLKKLDSENLQQPSLALQLDEDRLSESHKEDKKQEASEIFKDLPSGARIKASEPASDSTSDRNRIGSLSTSEIALLLEDDRLSEKDLSPRTKKFRRKKRYALVERHLYDYLRSHNMVTPRDDKDFEVVETPRVPPIVLEPCPSLKDFPWFNNGTTETPIETPVETPVETPRPLPQQKRRAKDHDSKKKPFDLHQPISEWPPLFKVKKNVPKSVAKSPPPKSNTPRFGTPKYIVIPDKISQVEMIPFPTYPPVDMPPPKSAAEKPTVTTPEIQPRKSPWPSFLKKKTVPDNSAVETTVTSDSKKEMIDVTGITPEVPQTKPPWTIFLEERRRRIAAKEEEQQVIDVNGRLVMMPMSQFVKERRRRLSAESAAERTVTSFISDNEKQMVDVKGSTLKTLQTEPPSSTVPIVKESVSANGAAERIMKEVISKGAIPKRPRTKPSLSTSPKEIESISPKGVAERSATSSITANEKQTIGVKGASPKRFQTKPSLLPVPKKGFVKSTDGNEQQTGVSTPRPVTPEEVQMKPSLLKVPEKAMKLKIPSLQDDSSDKTKSPRYFFESNAEKEPALKEKRKIEKPVAVDEPIMLSSNRTDVESEILTEYSQDFDQTASIISEKKSADQRSLSKCESSIEEILEEEVYSDTFESITTDLTSQQQSSVNSSQKSSKIPIPKRVASSPPSYTVGTKTTTFLQTFGATFTKVTSSKQTSTKVIQKEKTTELQSGEMTSDYNYSSLSEDDKKKSQTIKQVNVGTSTDIFKGKKEVKKSVYKQQLQKPTEANVLSSGSEPPSIVHSFSEEMETLSEVSTIESSGELSHIYKLTMQITNLHWTRPLHNNKVYVRFANPGILNAVRVEKKDLCVPSLNLTDIICNMFYLSRPSKLFDSVTRSLPRIFVYKQATKKLIITATIPIQDFLTESPEDYFHTNAQLIGKHEEVLGEIGILVKFTDMGVPPAAAEVTDLLKSVIEYKQTVNAPNTTNPTASQIYKEFRQLLSGFQQQARGSTLPEEETTKRKSQTQKLILNETTLERFIDFEDIDTEDEPSHHYLFNFDKSELECMKSMKQTKKHSFKAQQITKILKPSFIIVIRRCRGCSKEVEVGYDQRIWKDDDLVFWCKDCSDKQQNQLVKSTANILNLRDSVKDVQTEYAKYKANTIGKPEYDRLAVSEHNLTTNLFFSAKKEDFQLRQECQETTSGNLQHAIAEFEQQSIIEKQKEMFRQLEMQMRRDPPHHTFRMRDDCEACQIIHRMKAAPAITPKSGRQSSLKSFKTKFLSSTKDSHNLESDSSTVSLISDICVHDIRDKLDDLHAKIARCVEEREELLRAHQYASEHPVVSNLTDTINQLFNEWNELRIEFQKDYI